MPYKDPQKRKSYHRSYLKEWVKKHPEKIKEYELKNKTNPNYKESRKNIRLKCDYGITLNDYNVLLEQQNYVCAICGNTNGNKSLVVDHDHKTGKVRGLLCDPCNWFLGHASDSIDILISAISYLEKSK